MEIALDDYRWLVSGDGSSWLARAKDLAASSNSLTSLVGKLRKDLSAGRAHLVVEQIELRARAADKFAHAGQLYFTRKGLEQATEDSLAEYKAERFASGSRMTDFCCGIGGDLLALAARGPTVGIDADPVAAVLAEANLEALGLAGSRVEPARASAERLQGYAAWHCDPDRRPGGVRATTAELFSPPLPALNLFLSQLPSAAIKLAPATRAPSTWAEEAEREWLGSRRECRQQVAWFGSLARYPGRRTATVVSGSGRRTVVQREPALLDLAAAPRRFVFEPHSAVLAADLAAAVGAEHGLAELQPGIAYLTGDEPVDDLALDAFEVLDVLPFDRKQLRAYCREHDLGRLEIKKRGVEVDPQRLRKEIAAKGESEATLLVAPLADKVQAIVARRMVHS